MMAENAAARTGRDTLSKLSDELLLVIISLLPMKEAVRTSVLSKRWRYLYASRSDLEFNFSIPSVPIDVMNVVDRVFFYRKTCPIQKFLFRCSEFGAIDPCRLEGWIKCVLCYDVREIGLSIHSGLALPSNLFTCETLVKLHLSLFTGPLIEVPAKVFLPSLKVLSLATVFSFRKGDDCVERLLSNCPALENFVCFIGDNECRLIVSNPTLKYLSVVDYRGWSTSEGIGSFEISINAPNLVSLLYYVFDVDSHKLINVKSLSEATVSFLNRQGGNVVNYALAATDLMRGISGVRKLSIDSRLLENVLALNIPIPVFPNTTDLVIFHDAVYSFTDLLYVLTFFEALESLSLKTPSEFGPGDGYASEESRASCLSFRLKRIKLSRFDGETCQMKMVEYFLENAKVLEVLETDIYGRDSEEELEINKELLMFPRASEKCKVVISSGPIDEGNAMLMEVLDGSLLLH